MVVIIVIDRAIDGSPSDFVINESLIVGSERTIIKVFSWIKKNTRRRPTNGDWTVTSQACISSAAGKEVNRFSYTFNKSNGKQKRGESNKNNNYDHSLVVGIVQSTWTTLPRER